MLLHRQTIAHYLVAVLLVFLSGVCYGQKKKHRQKLTAYDSLFLESSYPENRKLLLGTWKYVQTESGVNIEKAKRYSADDSSRLYIQHDPRFSIRNFYVVHYVGNDSITKVLFSGLSDFVTNFRAIEEIKHNIKSIDKSYLKYLPAIAENIGRKNHAAYFPGDSIQLAKIPQYILKDSIGKSISYTFTLREVTVRRDSAGSISEASYPYIADTPSESYFGNRKILINVWIGKEEGLQLLDGMSFILLDIDDHTMRFVPNYISDHLRVTYRRE